MAQQNAQGMRDLVKQGKAMPAPGDSPGRYPIENRSDLEKAILAVGRVRPNTDAARAAVRRFIQKRAAGLNLSSLIPPNWDSAGNLKS